MNKILKYISTTFLTSALIAAASTSLPTVLAQDGDTTTVNLAVQAGAFEVVAPESVSLDDKSDPTPGNEQVTLSSTDELVSTMNSFKGDGAIRVTDLSGSGNGWSLNMRVENLSSSSNEQYYNILMGDTIDTDGNGVYAGNSFLTVTTSNVTSNSGSPVNQLKWSDSATDLDQDNNPVFDQLDLISYENNKRGITSDIPLLKAPAGAGMGEYLFHLVLDIDIPAYGDYKKLDENQNDLLAEHAVKGDTYSGTITFDMI